MLVNYSGREINAKLVYYGPGLSGKTTNLEYIYSAIPQTHRGKMVSMKTKTERTLFFDFLPIHLGELSGFRTRFLLYTVPGQVYYNATRKLVLKGVDAVVFVADSERGKMDENVESLQNLRSNLEEHGLSLDRIPWIIQYNKRDLPDVYSIEELEQVLNPRRIPSFEAVATSGEGVFDSFKAIARMLLKHLSSEIGVQVVASPAGPASGETGESEPSPPDRTQAPLFPPAAAPAPEQKVVEPAATHPLPPADPVAPPEAYDLDPQPPGREQRATEPGEGPGAAPSAPDRPEGVGERLRRWLAGSRAQEGLPDFGMPSEKHSPAAEPPPEPAILRLDAIGEPALESRSEFEPPPEDTVPEQKPEPAWGPEAAAEEPATPEVEAAFEPSPRPPEPVAPTVEEEPEIESEPEAEPAPEPEPESTRLAAVSIAVPPSAAESEQGRDVRPTSRFREVPILVDLDPEDLEVGVVLKLRIAVRQHGARSRERHQRSWVDRAA